MKRVKVVGIILICLTILSFITYYLYLSYYISPIPVVESVSINNDNKLMINFKLDEKRYRNKIYYIVKNNNLTKDIWWFSLDEDDKIIRVNNTENLGKITNININKEKVYIAINGTYNVSSSFDGIGKIQDEVHWYSENEDIAKVDENGKITGVKKGTTKVYAEIMNEKASVDVVVTNLITVRPKNYNSKKSYLPCGKYSKEENDLLDEILKDRINDAGYKTRAGAVEAARFLALEFPYKIRYFSENGRGSTNGVDGEGRYYHVGLYLHNSRYSGIKKKLAGPKTWGCSLYSRPSHGYRSNGLDCSGFVSWVLLNGGFDVGDIGAGLAPHKDLTDYGVRTKFNANIVKSGKVKVGDLLSSGGVQGGHIAIIVGEDDKYYYVAESLWTPPNVAVVIIPYSKKDLFKRYYYVMLMDSYYKEDGNLTKLWY